MKIFREISMRLNPYVRYLFVVVLMSAALGISTLSIVAYTLLVVAQVYPMRYQESYKSLGFNLLTLGMFLALLFSFGGQ